MMNFSHLYTFINKYKIINSKEGQDIIYIKSFIKLYKKRGAWITQIRKK